MEQHIHKAISLALKHWAYVDAVIEAHNGWKFTWERDSQRIKCQSAYLTGFLSGYLKDKFNPNKLVASVATHSTEQFHYATAYEHGQKHRKQDDEKEKAEKNEA